MKLRINRRGIVIGLILGLAATLSGIIVIRYTEGFFLVVILWVVLPVIILQFARRLRDRFRRR